MLFVQSEKLLLVVEGASSCIESLFLYITRLKISATPEVKSVFIQLFSDCVGFNGLAFGDSSRSEKKEKRRSLLVSSAKEPWNKKFKYRKKCEIKFNQAIIIVI